MGGHAVATTASGATPTTSTCASARPRPASCAAACCRPRGWPGRPRDRRGGPRRSPRFVVGTLPDGREERLELWLRNHLLDDYAALAARSERAEVDGRPVAYLSLPDLIRSKETEREGDWQDVALLEEILDQRTLAAARRGEVAPSGAAGLIRSRRGFAEARAAGVYADPPALPAAARACRHPVPLAYLAPLLPASDRASALAAFPALADPPVAEPLAGVPFGGDRHVGLVEVVRRRYRRDAMERDRREKLRRADEGRGG